MAVPGAQLPQDSELADIGIEPRLIPHIIAVESGVQQRTNDSDGSNDSDALPKEDAQTVVDILDEAVFVKPESKDRRIRILCNFSRLHGVRPSSYSPCGVTLSGEKPYKTAGSVDVWKGKLGGNWVCVKTFRLLGSGTEGIKQEFYREIVRWKYISHPNIIPFLGVLEGLPDLPRFCIISPWLEKGDIFEYTKENQDADRFELLAQTACGLDHLHSLDIKHGGIHPGNILINGENGVCLADIGITTIMTTAARSSAVIGAKPGCARYMAPELLRFKVLGSGEECRPSKESDVYSLGMTAFQVLSGFLPYEDIRTEPLIALEITQGRQPSRPPTDHQWLPDPIWKAIQRCWDDNPRSRPSTDSLYRTFAKSSGRPAQSPDGNDPLSPHPQGESTRVRENNASEKSGSRGWMKGVWYYCTCRCCYG